MVVYSLYSNRFVPRVAGKVIHVSADRFVNEQTGEPYYLAKVEISKDALANPIKTHRGMGYSIEV